MEMDLNLSLTTTLLLSRNTNNIQPVVVGGLQVFSVSPSPLLGLLGLELGWDWVWGDWGLKGLGLGSYGVEPVAMV